MLNMQTAVSVQYSLGLLQDSLMPLSLSLCFLTLAADILFVA